MFGVEVFEDSPEDYDLEIAKVAIQQNDSPRRIRARLERTGQMDALRNMIIERKVIDLITEKGGTLTCEVLPSLQSPFDLFQILIDDIKVYEISEVQDDWQSQELTIQPGKRQVTFRLVKDPNNLGEAVISSLPKDPDYQGQVWLDSIVFTANS